MAGLGLPGGGVTRGSPRLNSIQKSGEEQKQRLQPRSAKSCTGPSHCRGPLSIPGDSTQPRDPPARLGDGAGTGHPPVGTALPVSSLGIPPRGALAPPYAPREIEPLICRLPPSPAIAHAAK